MSNSNVNKRIDEYTISGLWITMFSFIVLSFIKEVINSNYMIHLYVDSLVAIISFYVVIHHLKKIYKLTSAIKPFLVWIVTLFLGLMVAIMMASSPFDITFLILVVGMMISKKMFIKQLNK